MQQFWVKTKHVKKGKAWDEKSVNPKKELAEIMKYRKLKIIREFHYFKTMKGVAAFVIKIEEEDKKSSFGRAFKDPKTGNYAIVRYRKY